MTEPPERITALRTRLETRMSAQRTMDSKMLDIYLQKSFLSVKNSETLTGPRPVGTGLGGFMVDQRVAVLTGPLFLRVAARGGQIADRHASDTLEPYLNGAFNCLNDDVEVRGLVEQDQGLYGEAFVLVIPAPFFWADDEMKGLAEKKASKKEYEDYKSQNLPIVMRHWDTRAVLPVFNDRGEPQEILYCRKMCADDIVARWGEGYLPVRNTKYKDSEEIEVTDYVNKTEIGVIIGKGTIATGPPSFKHHMGITPVAYFSGGKLPKNDYGLTRKGFLFHARELLPSMDEIMTDIRTNINDFTTAPPVVTINPEVRGLLEGWPNRVDWKGGNETTINLVTGETVGRFPVSQITIDAYQYLAKGREYLELTSLREGLSGSGPAGQSAVHLTGSNQISKAELQRYHDGLKRGYKKVGELLMRIPAALNSEYPDYPDKITVRYKDAKHQSKEIAVSPDDTQGWHKMVTADIDLNLPINEGGNVQNYSIATKSGGLSEATARERYLNVQNPYEEADKIAEENLYKAIITLTTQYLTQRAAGAIEKQGATSPVGLIQQAANLPQFAQESLARSFNPQQQEELGNLARGATSEARAGRGQQLSELSGNNTEVPA